MGRRAGRLGVWVCLLAIACLTLPALGAATQQDLEIAHPTLTPEIVEQGDTAVLRAVVSSSGSVTADTVTVRIAVRRVDLEDECCYSERALTSQQVRSGYSIEEPIDTSSREPGTYAITISVDPSDLIREESETNNQASLFLQVLALKPELHPQQLSCEPASPVDRGQAVAITTEVENSGRREAGGFSVRFFLFPAFTTSAGATEQFSAPTSGGAFDAVSVEDASVISFDSWLEEVGDVLEDDVWIPFWSANVAGMGLDDDAKLVSVLPTGQGLRDLLVPMYFTSDEMAALQEGTTVYAIRIVVDSAESVVEEDETNNTLVGSLTVRPSTLALPDLHVVGLSLEGPLPMEYGDTQDVTVTVVNTGGAPAPVRSGSSSPVVRVELQYRPAGVGSNAWHSLGVATIATVGEPLGIEEGNNRIDNDDLEIDVDAISLPPGDYELKAIVDPEDQIAEQREDNNEITIGFSLEGGELHPVGLEIASDELRQGGAFSLSAPIRNTGKLTLSSFVVGFFLDDVRFDTFYYYEALSGENAGLEEGDVAWAQGVLDTEGISPGEYELRVVVDPDNVIPEMDEANNEIVRTIRILSREARKPELVPVSVKLTPDSPLSQATSMDVQIEVLNRGTLDAGSFVVALELQDEDDSEWRRVSTEGDAAGILIPSLARGGRTVVSFGVGGEELSQLGTYRLRVVVDVESRIEELDEENNVLEVGLWVGPPEAGSAPAPPYANLVFRSLQVSPTQNLDAREQVSVVEAVIWNAGLEASGPFDMTLCWRNSSGICTSVGGAIRVSGLAAEETTDVAAEIGPVEAPVTPGTYQLVATLDSGDEVDEHSREFDNTASVRVQVTGMVKPDLTVEELWFGSEPPFEVGQDVRLYARIRNRSRDVAAGAFDVRFEQKDGGPLQDVSVGRLGPSASLDLSFEVATAEVGEFLVSVTADVENTVLESDDDDATNNNTGELSFSVMAVPSVPVEEAISIGGAVRHLVNDSGSGTLYAGSSSGRVVAVRYADSSSAVFDVSVNDAVAGLALVSGTALYVGTESGSIFVLDPRTGVERNEIVLPESLSVTCMKAGAGGYVYVGTSDGVIGIDSAGALLTGSMPSGSVIGLGVDPLDGFVHAATESALYTLDPQLVLQCVYTGAQGTHTALAAGPGTLYVGTMEGEVLAYSRCATFWMWRYPASGLIGSPVTSVLVDPGDIDPVYVATQDGRLISLDLFGEEQWTHAASAGLESRPVWDGRTGRVFAVDANGTPYVLSASGAEAFPVDPATSLGVGVSSSLAFGEYLTGSGSGARLVRVYYYGGDDGVVYVIRTDR